MCLPNTALCLLVSQEEKEDWVFLDLHQDGNKRFVWGCISKNIYFKAVHRGPKIETKNSPNMFGGSQLCLREK